MVDVGGVRWATRGFSGGQVRDLIGRLVDLEADVRYQNPPVGDELEFGYTPGRVPILISAPHGAKHARFYPKIGKRKCKDEDEFTAGLARLVAEKSGAHVIWLRRKSSKDGNSDLLCRYKDEVSDIVHRNSIRFVLDIHGVRAGRRFGIALGTADGESCKPETQDLIIETLSRFDFTAAGSVDHEERLRRIEVNAEGYKASGCGTITRQVSNKLGIGAAQLELNAHLRIPQRRKDASSKEHFETDDPVLIVKTVEALTELVHVLADVFADSPAGRGICTRILRSFSLVITALRNRFVTH
jgi:hypothetical protein